MEVETEHYIDGILVSHSTVKQPSEWFNLEDDPIYNQMLENISIGYINPYYINVNEIQNKEDEYAKILRFLDKYMDHYSNQSGIKKEDLNIEFINYGKTELVYVLTKKDGDRITLLVKQPGIKYGDVYKDYSYLKELASNNENIVEPIDYFTIGDQELYVTPYINQARCVASCGTWGMYIPEPYYRFQSFTEEQQDIVCQCMIAKLISMYDFEKQEGIAKCKLGGGDFMLPKGWETETPTIENTLNNLLLISCRDKIKCSFTEYINIIISEFSRITINENEDKLMVNLRGRVSMSLTNIKKGIKLGKSLIEEKSKKDQPKKLVKKIKKDNKGNN